MITKIIFAIGLICVGVVIGMNFATHNIEPTANIDVIWVSGDEEVSATLHEVRSKIGFKAKAMAYWKYFDNGDVEKTRCIIYAKTPRSESDKSRLRLIGHELTHCVSGNFHK